MYSKKSSVNLIEAIHHLDTLPAMPVIAQKILALNLESDEGERAMLKLIEKDPQIAAKIIGLANTPLFGAAKRITSVSDASMLLGITRVKSVTMGIAVMSSLIKKPAGRLDVQGLWLHSLAIALAMRTIAHEMPRNMRPLEDEIFLAGLLHDIGFMVLNHLDQKRSDELQLMLATDKDHSSAEIENNLLELNHGELGAELAHFWELPDHIVAVLRYHHDPENVLAEVGQPLVRMVNLAEKTLTAFGIAEYEDAQISLEEWQSLGIAADKAQDIIQKIKEQAEETKSAAGSFP